MSSEEAKRCTAFPLTKTAALPTFSSHHKPRISRLVNQHSQGAGGLGVRRGRLCVVESSMHVPGNAPARHSLLLTRLSLATNTEAQTGQAPAGEIHVGRRPQETSPRQFLTSRFPPLPLVVVQPPPATCTCSLSKASGHLRQMPEEAQAGKVVCANSKRRIRRIRFSSKTPHSCILDFS